MSPLSRPGRIALCLALVATAVAYLLVLRVQLEGIGASDGGGGEVGSVTVYSSAWSRTVGVLVLTPLAIFTVWLWRARGRLRSRLAPAWCAVAGWAVALAVLVEALFRVDRQPAEPAFGRMGAAATALAFAAAVLAAAIVRSGTTGPRGPRRRRWSSRRGRAA